MKTTITIEDSATPGTPDTEGATTAAAVATESATNAGEPPAWLLDQISAAGGGGQRTLSRPPAAEATDAGAARLN